jgi:hypothetical protein
MEKQRIGFENVVSVGVTVMRNGEARGDSPDQLQDGNTIPRLCSALGEGACAQACIVEGEDRKEIGVLCAENNIANALEEFGVEPENFVLVGATADNIFFGDSLEDTRVFESKEGYSQLPESNAFFFRPGIDKGPNGKLIDAMGMRMADCGSVNMQFIDSDGNLVIGQAHFSRTNMHGPSEFNHELNGEKVSWGEFVIGSAMKHYGASSSSVRIHLSAAVEGKDFIHNFDTDEKMQSTWKGWDELGFLHRDEHSGDTLINYREMIDWQLKRAGDSFAIPGHFINTDKATNTGDVSTGHASHHWSSKRNNFRIAPGRDLYITGVDLDNLAVIAANAKENADMYTSSAQFEEATECYEYASRINSIINGRRNDLYRPSY